MDLDPKLLKQLIETFQTELEEQLQVITDGLLALETKPEKYKSLVDTMFRAAHSIKGSSRSLNISTIGDIAHKVESLFSLVQKNEIVIDSRLVTLILEAEDKIRLAMQAHLESIPLSFDLADFLKKLDKPSADNTNDDSRVHNAKIVKPKLQLNKTSEHDSIRVSISQIDKITSLIENMQVTKIAIEDDNQELTKIINYYSEFSDKLRKIHSENDAIVELKDFFFKTILPLSNQLNFNFKNHTMDLSIVFKAIQSEVNTLRLIPFSNLMATFPRYVRDMALQLDKKVELVMTGEDVKIDKIILENLKDPILHIVRNSIDHGIETKENRANSGKPEIATIRIDVEEEGGRVSIKISDDGAGIDLDLIKKAAINKKIVSVDGLMAMNSEQILNLIFQPGFSTKDIITDISGRGVGLDIVRTNLVPIKGEITVNTQVGKGTTFCIQVPLTLSSERGLMVESCDQLFVFLTSSIDRLIRIDENQIVEVEAQQVVMIDNHPIPLTTLSALLNLDVKGIFNKVELFVVIIKKGVNKIALLVDKIIGEREIIVKPLQDILKNLKYISGGTLYGNNQVVLVLNSNELINRNLNLRFSPLEFKEQKPEIVSRPHILVVDDSITTRTLERNILEMNNYVVTVAANGKEAWDLLQKNKYSLVITDVLMPIMNGFELTKNLKENDKTSSIPVIIVTSLDSDEEKKRGIEVGADAYIVKNEFESGTFLEIVSQLV